MTQQHTLVLLDPTAEHGEAALDLARSERDRITLLLVLDGPSAGALADFAASEGTTVAEAGDFYLDQVCRAMPAASPAVDALSLDTSDPVAEIVRLATGGDVDRVAIPAETVALRSRDIARLARTCPVPVVVAPGHAA